MLRSMGVLWAWRRVPALTTDASTTRLQYAGRRPTSGANVCERRASTNVPADSFDVSFFLVWYDGPSLTSPSLQVRARNDFFIKSGFGGRGAGRPSRARRAHEMRKPTGHHRYRRSVDVPDDCRRAVATAEREIALWFPAADPPNPPLDLDPAHARNRVRTGPIPH